MAQLPGLHVAMIMKPTDRMLGEGRGDSLPYSNWAISYKKALG
ncbi:hypothetical protein VCHA53O463_330008 [Vibrio chagasii]|nr:hypothetical protein VCHA56P515_310008 [Vibrio chagasii]CAH7277952.1 hypothetical protein VCHA53O463_330008 [Vibrio chagasii]